jgi:hypothetical protein
MAQAGGVTQAYRCWLEEGRLRMIPTSMLRDMCEAPDVAILMIRSGLVATVAGADVDEVRRMVTKEEVGT